jgi:hypothetical protein
MDNNPNGQSPADDGFGGSLSDLSARGGNYAKYDDQQKWRDRDGIDLHGRPYLVGSTAKGRQRWIDNRPELILDWANVDDLNAAIPKEEWPKNLDGEREPPSKRVVVAILIDLATGAVYKFVSPTIGARIAVEALQEQVIVMRALRGSDVLPIVMLEERPRKTRRGITLRPHFEIVDWKTPGGIRDRAFPSAATPQLPRPAPMSEPTAPTRTPSTQTPPTQTPPAAERAPKPHPIPAPATKSPIAKQPVKLSNDTLAAMGNVKPPTTEEILDDSLDDLPWDSDPQQHNK